MFMKIHPYNKFGRLEALSRKLEECAKQKWGVTGLQAPFLPLADLDLGDLGTDFPTRVAASLRCPASEVSQELANIIKSEGVELLVFEGFLNVRLGSGPGRITHEALSPLSVPPLDSISLVLPYRSNRESPHGMLRRAALLGLQSSLIKEQNQAGRVSIFDGGGEALPDPLTDGGSYWRRVRELSQKLPTAKNVAGSKIAEVIRNKKSALTFVWAAEEIWNQREYKSLQEHTDLLTQFASSAWLEEWGSETEFLGIFNRIEQNPNDAFYLLSDPMRGSDIEGSVLGSQERANLRWYAGATLERIGQILPSHSFDNYASLLSDSVLRGVLLKALFLRDFALYGALRGQIWGYLGVLRGLLDGANRLLNDPSFRQELHRGAASLEKVSLLKITELSLSHPNT
jgi:hypothetical protein